MLLLVAIDPPLLGKKLYGDKAYTCQFYQRKLWEEFSIRLVVEAKRCAK